MVAVSARFLLPLLVRMVNESGLPSLLTKLCPSALIQPAWVSKFCAFSSENGRGLMF